MSVVANIKTKTTIVTKDLLKYLSLIGYQVIFDENESKINLFRNKLSIRTIILSHDIKGYTFNLPVFACEEDFFFFRDIVSFVHQKTLGKLSYEDHNNVKDIFLLIDDEYIKSEVKKQLDYLHVLLVNKTVVEFYGTTRSFIIGPKMTELLLSEQKPEDFEKAFYFWVRRSQYLDMNAENAQRMELNKEKIIVNFFMDQSNRFIPKVDMVSIFLDKQDYFFILFESLDQIKPDNWIKIDEYQFYAPKFKENEWKEFVLLAQKFKFDYQRQYKSKLLSDT